MLDQLVDPGKDYGIEINGSLGSVVVSTVVFKAGHHWPKSISGATLPYLCTQLN